MKSNSLLWLTIAVVALVGVWYWTTRPETPPVTDIMEEAEETVMSDAVMVELSEQNDLGQSGTATLETDEDGMLMVTLTMTGGEFDQPQPAHIHSGECPNPGAVVYPLTSVVDGQSVSTLDVSWDDLMAAGEPMAVNVHKSAAEASVYTACGDLPIQ